jgi:hypothetical protein
MTFSIKEADKTIVQAIVMKTTLTSAGDESQSNIGRVKSRACDTLNFEIGLINKIKISDFISASAEATHRKFVALVANRIVDVRS